MAFAPFMTLVLNARNLLLAVLFVWLGRWTLQARATEREADRAPARYRGGLIPT